MAHKVSLKYTNGPSVIVTHTFEIEYLSAQVVSLNQILYVASLGSWEGGCIRF